MLARSKLKAFNADRIFWMALLVVGCLVAVLLLRSQSAASYPTYALAILMLLTIKSWKDVLGLSLIRFVLLLLLWLSASTLWSQQFDFRDAVSIWTRSLLVFLFVIAVAECQLRGEMQKWMTATLSVVGTATALAALINFQLTNPVDGRLNGLGQLDTHVVAALVFGIILLFVVERLWSASSRVLISVGLLAALLLAYIIFLSDSRNAWVSVLLGLLTLWLTHRCRDVRLFLAALVVGIFLIGVALVLVALSDDLRGIVLPREDSFRILIWETTLGRIREEGAVLIGRGILTVDDVSVGTLVFAHAHNMYLALVHQGGIVALGLFGAVLGITFLVLLRSYEQPDAKLAVSILVLACSSYLLDGHELVEKVSDTWFLVWYPVGLAVGLSLRPKETGGSIAVEV